MSRSYVVFSVLCYLPGYHCLFAKAKSDTAMPFYHTVQGAFSNADGSSTILSSISKGYTLRWQWDRPLAAMDFPLDGLTMVSSDPEEMGYDELLLYLQGTGRDFWIARSYANYENGIDFYVRFSIHPGRVFHYTLDVDPRFYLGRPAKEGVYADPFWWYMAKRKVFKGNNTEADFVAYWTSLGSGYRNVDPMTVDDATMGGTVDEAAIAEAAIAEDP